MSQQGLYAPEEQNDVVNIDGRIKQIEAKIKNPEKMRLGLEKFSNSLNSLINRLEKGDLVSLRLFASQGASEKDILVRNRLKNLEIDAQKRVIYRYKSPFNFIFEPEFSTGSPVGEPRRTVLETPLVVAKTLYYGTPNLHFCIPVATEGEVRHQTVPVNYKL